jgi:microcystin-dependent protein
MAEPFMSEIRLMSFSFPPRGWALCNGQLLPINQNQALFSLLGTTYGGDGRVNFALPNFQGRTPIHVGAGNTLGQVGGAQNHTVSVAELPTHTHRLSAASGNAATNNPNGNALANATAVYHAPSNLTALNPGSISSTGGSQAHINMQPYLTLNFCIALQGIYPSPN